MADKYGECHKAHKHLDWRTDGCLEFVKRSLSEREQYCGGCGCHRSFHRKVEPEVKYKTEVVYTKCQKIHDFKFQSCADGCQEFIPTAEQGAGALVCATCGCDKGFHRNEITTQKGDEKREQLRFSNKIETNMEDKYAECKNYHWDSEALTDVTDGCQEYMASESDPLACVVCDCHRNFHRKVTRYRWDVVYTKCHKVHELNGEGKVDGCQEFFPGAGEGSEATLFCATCGCHKGFHRNEIKKEITSTS